MSRRLTFLSFVDLEYFRMRVIQMTTDVEVKAAEKNNIEKPRDPDRTRDLFGVQLEVRRPIKYSLAFSSSSSSLIFTFFVVFFEIVLMVLDHLSSWKIGIVLILSFFTIFQTQNKTKK
jgi:hypothetical protein